MALGSYFINRVIQIFRDNLIITGINPIMVATIAINVLTKVVPTNKNAITKAATAKAIPTP